MADSVIIYRESLQPFSAACGGNRPLRLSVRRRGDGSTVETPLFDQPFVRIGRSVNNDLVLSDPGVSFRHMYLQIVDGNWACFNLHSTVRAQGRGRRPTAWNWLDEVRELNIGPYALRRELNAYDAPPDESQPAQRGLAPAVTGFELELVNRRNHPTRRITRPVTLIGSARHCSLWLKDPSVSSVHASLVLTQRGLWIIDLLGRNGVTVDRRQVRWKQLQNGSFVELGRFSFRVWLNNAEPATSEVDAPQIDVNLDASPTGVAGPIDAALTREFVLGVLEHLVESRGQFFDHLHSQSQLVHGLLRQLHEAKAAAQSREFEQVLELNRELAEVKRQLDQLASARDPRAEAAPAEDSMINSSADPTPPKVTATDDIASTPPESDFDTNLKPDDTEGEATGPTENVEPTGFILPPTPSRVTPSGDDHAEFASVQDAHALISQRMSKLTQERNSRWRELLRKMGLGGRD